MKKLLTTMMICLFALGMQAQRIANESLWYNGNLCYTAKNQHDGKIVMNAMAEGEEHEFLLVPVAGSTGSYRIAKSPNDYMMEYKVGSTVKFLQKEGWNLLCIYGADNSLQGVMEKTEKWDTQELNISKWINQLMGHYKTNDGDVWLNWETLTVNGTDGTYKLRTFNGIVTGYIDIEGTHLAGTWGITPTLEGLKLYSVVSTDNEFEYRRTGREIVLTADHNSNRFSFASHTLLNSGLHQRFDKAMLRVMRNAIMASHGYRFQSRDLQEYFTKQPWYHPVDDNNKVKLTFLEELNVELIKKAEKD